MDAVFVRSGGNVGGPPVARPRWLSSPEACFRRVRLRTKPTRCRASDLEQGAEAIQDRRLGALSFGIGEAPGGTLDRADLRRRVARVVDPDRYDAAIAEQQRGQPLGRLLPVHQARCHQARTEAAW
jgi:hypothetical protein